MSERTGLFLIMFGFVERRMYSGLTLNQDKATKPQTVQIVRQGEATPYWFKVNPLYCGLKTSPWLCAVT